MRRRIQADFIFKYTEMGKEEIDDLGMKLDLNIMVGGTVPVINLPHYEHSMNT